MMHIKTLHIISYKQAFEVNLLQERDIYKRGQFEFDSVINWKPTSARQSRTHCNLERSCLAMFISELQ